MGDAAQYAIKMHRVTKTFGKVVANKNVDLELKTGEILALLGENGSGKTTLMNMLSGIYFPDYGEIYVKGEEVTIRSPKDSFALGIGMIHQHFKLVDVLTAAENIVLGLEGKAVLKRREINQKVAELAKKYGFDLDPTKKVYNMSVSEKQTVGHLYCQCFPRFPLSSDFHQRICGGNSGWHHPPGIAGQIFKYHFP